MVLLRVILICANSDMNLCKLNVQSTGKSFTDANSFIYPDPAIAAINKQLRNEFEIVTPLLKLQVVIFVGLIK